MNKQDVLKKISLNPKVSVLIIGGGINGLGTFRDLALQGIDVLLVDREDFCSGASAASSRMVHGGIRYLENGEFRLVREAVRERNRLIENAPHYVKPLPTTIPIFKRFSGLLNAPLKFLNLLDRPGERGGLVIKLGLMLYDSYASQQGTVPKHEFWGRKKSLGHFPELNPDIISTATYFDGSMRDAERIAIEVMLDGEAANEQAHALNYVAAVGAEKESVWLEDRESGQRYAVRPDIVINAAGPWIDFVNRAMGDSTQMIGGTKGSHMVLDHPQLFAACHQREFFFENTDGRIVLIYPLGERVIVGTSDIPIDDPDQATCTEEEIEYFINFIKIVFPSIEVSRSQVIYTFSGVRPLPRANAKTTGQISRDHQNSIIEPNERFPFPIFNLIGGKWTSFRAFSEQVTDEALARLGKKRLVDTKKQPIGGGKNYPKGEPAQQQWLEAVAADSGLPIGRVAQLFDRYGTRAEAIAHYIAAAQDQPLKSCPDYSQREIQFVAEQEKVVYLLDFLQRRSLLALRGQVTQELLGELAEIIGEIRGWAHTQRESEVNQAIALLQERHGVNFNGGNTAQS